MISELALSKSDFNSPYPCDPEGVPKYLSLGRITFNNGLGASSNNDLSISHTIQVIGGRLVADKMQCSQTRATPKRTTMVMAAGTKDPVLLLGSIVLQSFVVHLK